MSRQPWTMSWWGRGAVIAAALLMLAVALCVFDTDRDGAHDGGGGVDLCNASLMVTAIVIALGRPSITGRWRSDPIPSFAAVPLPRLDPPPKPVTLS